MKAKPGKVQSPKASEWLWDDLFKRNIVKEFVGMTGTMQEIKSPEGQKKIAKATADTTAALGYTREAAIEQDMHERIFRNLQYSKPEDPKEMLDSDEVESVM